MNNDRNNDIFIQQRRSFLKAGTVAWLGTAFAGLSNLSMAEEHSRGEARMQFKVDPLDQVRVGFVGVGGMGTNHLQRRDGLYRGLQVNLFIAQWRTAGSRCLRRSGLERYRRGKLPERCPERQASAYA
jgi:hypothetical protein